MEKAKKALVIGGSRYGGFHAQKLENQGYTVVQAQSDNHDAVRETILRTPEAISDYIRENTIAIIVIATLPDQVSDMVNSVLSGEYTGQILVEKPVGMNEQETTDILSGAKEKDVSLIMGGQTRYNPAWKEGIDTLSKQNIKRIEIVRCFVNPNEAEKTKTHGPVSLNLMPHSIGELEYILSKNGLSLDNLEIKDINGDDQTLSFTGEIQTGQGVLNITIRSSHGATEKENYTEITTNSGKNRFEEGIGWDQEDMPKQSDRVDTLMLQMQDVISKTEHVILDPETEHDRINSVMGFCHKLESER